jgi:hypothetical protein
MTPFFLFLGCAEPSGKFYRIKPGKPEVAGSCRDAAKETAAAWLDNWTAMGFTRRFDL